MLARYLDTDKYWKNILPTGADTKYVEVQVPVQVQVANVEVVRYQEYNRLVLALTRFGGHAYPSACTCRWMA